MNQMDLVEKVLEDSLSAMHIEDVANVANLSYHQASCCLKRLNAAGRAHRSGKGVYSKQPASEIMANLFIMARPGQTVSYSR